MTDVGRFAAGTFALLAEMPSKQTRNLAKGVASLLSEHGVELWELGIEGTLATLRLAKAHGDHGWLYWSERGFTPREE